MTQSFYSKKAQQQKQIEDRDSAEEFRRVVYFRADGRSQITGAQDHIMDPHHCIKARRLRKYGLEWEPDFGMLLTRAEHDLQERRTGLIPFERLPNYVVKAAEHHGLTYLLEQEHPRREDIRPVYRADESDDDATSLHVREK